jgi:quercetin dioxygenase-like cupin family protein
MADFPLLLAADGRVSIVITSQVCGFARTYLSDQYGGACMERGAKDQSLKEIMAQAATVADLVDYQKGAVVSRTIINRKTGTVTLFAFDKEQGLSEHTAPFDALVQVIEGQAEIVISGKPLRLHQGEMTIMPANAPHALKAIERFKMILTMIRS